MRRGNLAGANASLSFAEHEVALEAVPVQVTAWDAEVGSLGLWTHVNAFGPIWTHLDPSGPI